MYPKTQEEFKADCAWAQELAYNNATNSRMGGKSEWMVEFEGVQYFFTAEKV